ncbi:MAG: hypothetical protein DDT40_01525 [candidate division WS2 bacterium]|nr:hypothetical protein [Candidatus Psychracetigena formicireducens]
MAPLGANQLLKEDLEDRRLAGAGAAGQDAQSPGEQRIQCRLLLVQRHVLAVGFRFAEEPLERGEPIDRGIGGGGHFLGPPFDHRSGELLQGLEVLERNQLRIRVEGHPQEPLVEVRLGQHDLPIRPARSPLGEAAEDAAQEVGEREDRVSVAGGLLEDCNTNGADPAPVVVGHLVIVGEQRGVSLGSQAVIDRLQGHGV